MQIPSGTSVTDIRMESFHSNRSQNWWCAANWSWFSAQIDPSLHPKNQAKSGSRISRAGPHLVLWCQKTCDCVDTVLTWTPPPSHLLCPFQTLPGARRRRASVRRQAATGQVTWRVCTRTTAACPGVLTKTASRLRVGPSAWMLCCTENIHT